jgi:hypothetical protein
MYSYGVHASEYGEYRGLAVPDGIAATAFLILPISQALSSVKQRRRRRRGMCPACGYDLRATPDRCPECGAVPAAKGAAA